MKKYYLLLVCAAVIGAACSTVSPSSEKRKPTKELSFMEKLSVPLGRGDYAAALALFGTLSPEEAESDLNRQMQASIFMSAGKLREARTTIGLVLAKNSTNLEAQFILSNIEAQEGNVKQQRALLDSIVKADPQFVPALDTLGYLAINSQSLKNAEIFFDRALGVDAKDIDALVGRAAVYRRRKNPEQAVKLLTQAIEYHPSAVEPLAERGRIYRETGKLQPAIEDLQKAEKLDANNYWIIFDKARVLLDMNKKPDALALFEQAEKIDPSNFLAYVYSAGIRDELSDYKNAAHDYEVLAKLKPDYYFANEMLGVYFLKDKQFAKARDAFKKAFDTAPDEYNYALLALISGVSGGQQAAQFKPFLEQVMRKIDRSKLDYYLVRLFYDFSGDADVARRVGAEKNPRIKALGFFYLANYFDIQGNHSLAGTYYNEFATADRKDMIEWRIYNWVIAERALEKTAGTTALKN
jgi:tetratricopeptide (TPR) repeat protein